MFLIAVHVLHGVTIECLSEFDRCDRRAFVEGPQLRRQPLSDAQILIDRGDVGGIPAVTTALWGCLVARNAYAYS